MSDVLVRGDGLATAACARLLSVAGWHISIEVAPRPKLPAVLLNEASQTLLLDVFEVEGLLSGLYPIQKRIVKWGEGSEVLTLPHRALAVSEDLLLRRLPPVGGTGENVSYTLHGARPLPAPTSEYHCGGRDAEAVAIHFRGSAEANACWVESVADGWLFAVCTGDGQGWLLAMGESANTLLAQSTLIAGCIESVAVERKRFAAHPRIAKPLTGPGWLACGGAAMAFDPICGEGTGHALREAILAAAVMQAHARGEDWDLLAQLYVNRFEGGFRRHLVQCHQLYSSGGSGPWWREQVASVEAGLAWLGLERRGETTFRLEGFELVRLAS